MDNIEFCFTPLNLLPVKGVAYSSLNFVYLHSVTTWLKGHDKIRNKTA